MEKAYQVFISSTYADLKDERRRVSETLAKAGYIPAGMELFPASDQQQLEFIKRVIDRCDYYVVIVGGRYGSLADENVSFTEKEYEYALEKNIPVLAFLHGDPDEISLGKTDKDTSKAEKLKTFRNRLANGRMIDHWNEANELCTKIVIAVGQAITLTPGIGWVRGDQAIDPKVLQELERLRIENEGLKARLIEINEADVNFPVDLAGPDHKITFVVTVNYFAKDKGGGRNVIRIETLQVGVTIGELFVAIFDDMLTEPSEFSLRTIIGQALLAITERTEPDSEAEIEQEEVTNLRFHFEALGLIQAGGKEYTSDMFGRSYTRNYIAWHITDKGRKFVTRQRAIQK